MKRKLLYVLMITSLLSLSACGSSVSADDYTTVVSESTSSKTETNPSSTENDPQANKNSAPSDDQSNDSTLSDPTDSLDDLTRQSKELANSSEEITEGELYDSITAIYPDVVIRTDANNDLSIRINLNHDTIETDSLAFFETIISICESCSLENVSSNISFIMMVDGKFVTMLSMLDYASLANFSTTSPVVLVDEYEETIGYIYSTLFSKNDISNQFDEYLDSLEQ